MKFKTIENDNETIAIVISDEKVIIDTQTSIDLLMSAKYDAGTKDIIINKECICDDFFILSTGVAGEILQKYKNYGCRLAIYGDFSKYTSKPLKDFIRETNKGRDFFFVETLEKAIEKLKK